MMASRMSIVSLFLLSCCITTSSVPLNNNFQPQMPEQKPITSNNAIAKGVINNNIPPQMLVQKSSSSNKGVISHNIGQQPGGMPYDVRSQNMPSGASDQNMPSGASDAQNLAQASIQAPKTIGKAAADSSFKSSVNTMTGDFIRKVISQTIQISSITEQISPVTDELWEMVPKLHNYWVVSGGIAEHLIRYGIISKDSLYLFMTEFSELPDNTWTKDFASLNCTAEYSNAYYRLLDIYTSNIIRVLSLEDMDAIIGICERVTDGSNGFLTESQFKTCFKEVIFRPAPLSLLFEKCLNSESLCLGKAEGVTPSVLVRKLTPDQFNEIFHGIDTDSNEKISDDEMGAFWESRTLGPKSDGEVLFKKLDYEDQGELTRSDWQRLFDDLDCNDNHGNLDFLEFLQLDLILHDKRDYPSKECKLDRE